MFNYVATAFKSTVVSYSVKGNFTSPDEYNLIVGSVSPPDLFCFFDYSLLCGSTRFSIDRI